MAYVARFREVLEEGSIEQRKEFLRGFVHEISIDPDAARGTITFYELPISSLMMVPGARDQLIWNNLPSRRRGVGFTVKNLLGRSAGRRSRRTRQGASTTSHSDIRGLRQSPGAVPHDRAPSGENAVYYRESGKAISPVA